MTNYKDNIFGESPKSKHYDTVNQKNNESLSLFQLEKKKKAFILNHMINREF